MPSSWRSTRIFMSIASGLFLLNIILFLLYHLDEKQTEDFRKYEPTRKCKFLEEDHLAISALSRMRTQQCKLMLEHRLCSMDFQKRPAAGINTCRKYFDPAERYAFVGCFHDSPSDRLLKEYRFNFSTSNSHEFCAQNCLRAGFPLAGVEFGVECFCGTSFADDHHPADDGHLCQQYSCPGNNSQFCGGFKAIHVLRTGVQGKHTQHLPTFHPFNSSGEVPKAGGVKILFLFQLNGRNSRQIRRLLRMIYSPAHLYYVHVDVRQHFMHSEMLKIQHELARLNRIDNFRVVEGGGRLETIWGGTHLLELFLGAIAETVNHPISAEWRKWDYILNLSEADMPLLSLEELEHMLAHFNGNTFLSSHGYNTATFLHKQGFNFHFMQCEQRMWRVATRADFLRDLRLDGGSDWVIVHRDLAEFAISQADLPSQLRLLFTTILLPLESFFHTLALNSGQFCERILYRNLRFTNWRRKQGCRCAALKSIVDWCGCSPLALRSDEDAQRKVRLKIAQEKSHFFGRKFDSFVHTGPIAFVERQALRFRPHLIPSIQRASFNATWINVFSARTQNDSQFVALLNHILDSLLNANAQFPHVECKFQRLLDVHIFKANSSAQRPQSVFTVEVECPHRGIFTIEILLSKFDDDKDEGSGHFGAEDGQFQFDSASGIEYGIGFDVKEEIFRTYPPIMDINDHFTLLWRWQMMAGGNFEEEETRKREKTRSSNWTSPAVQLELHGPPDGGDGSGGLMTTTPTVIIEQIGPYDSVNGNQFTQIHLGKLENAHPGTWKAILYHPSGQGRKRIQIADCAFPLFPANHPQHLDRNYLREQLARLVSLHFGVPEGGLCAIEASHFPGNMANCAEQNWSTFFPDEKSKFP